jgi:hypothetical protein
MRILVALIIFSFGHTPFARAACFDPAVTAGYAFKDQVTQSLVVTQLAPAPHGIKVGDTIVGIGVNGLYYGCRIRQTSIAAKTSGAKKINLFLPLRGATVQGFELDISLESRRILAGRPIQVPWSVVDRTLGVTAACTESNPTAFEGFLYGALRSASARRCTQLEIEAIVGPARAATRAAGSTTFMKPTAPPAKKGP